jgi:diaminopimelate dehydrogenase
MNEKIRIGICGYGNLGKGVESEIIKNPDLELVCIFTRREVTELYKADKTAESVPFIHADEAAVWKDKINVLILCGGSKSDLPVQGPVFAKIFNTVDSYDTHAKIPAYFTDMDKAAKEGGNLSVISAGWDPGLFSLQRLMMSAVIPAGETYSFWGPGVSQGHSEAIRGVEGVADAVQYTIPNEAVLDRIRNGETPTLSVREKHERVCYVVIEDGADNSQIENEIKAMPDYFADYDTTVHFITQEELKTNHEKMRHGGNVIRTGKTGNENKQVQEYILKLDSNPEFTASVLVAYARAVFKMSEKGECGAKTVFDVPPGLLSMKSPEELRRDLL